MQTTSKAPNGVRRNAQVKPAAVVKIMPTEKPTPLPPEEVIPVVLIPLDKTDLSPLNYRVFYDPAEMVRFAENIKASKGLIHPVTVRVVTKGRYEMVVGERRYRGCELAGCTHIEARIRVLTDAQVREMQLWENLQRENPHPMRTAFAIGILKQEGLSPAQIAVRLSKALSFVQTHQNLLDLLPALQEVFQAGFCTMAEALEMAQLAAEQQQEIFDRFYKKWKEPDFVRPTRLKEVLSNYKCYLNNADFDTKDPNLYPEAGACQGCPFNSASRTELFPDLTREATCLKKECFAQKNRNNVTKTLEKLMQGNPAGLVIDGEPMGALKELLETIPGLAELKQYQWSAVDIVNMPTAPDKESYVTDEDEEDEQNDGDTEETQPAGTFQEEMYNNDLREYEEDMQAFQAALEKGTLLTGIRVARNSFIPVYFRPEKASKSQQPAPNTAKYVQEAIKAKKATPAMLQGEIERINKAEIRKKELDREAVQEEVCVAYKKRLEDPKAVVRYTNADTTVARLLIFNMLSYADQQRLCKALKVIPQKKTFNTDLYKALAGMSNDLFAQMVRLALAVHAERDAPTTPRGHFLYQLSAAIGVDVKAIERTRNILIDKRNESQRQKIAVLQQLKKKLQKNA